MGESYHEQLLNEGYEVLHIIGDGDEEKETPLRGLASALLKIVETTKDLPLEAMRIVPADLAFKGEPFKLLHEEKAHLFYVKKGFIQPGTPRITYIDVEDRQTREWLCIPGRKNTEN